MILSFLNQNIPKIYENQIFDDTNFSLNQCFRNQNGIETLQNYFEIPLLCRVSRLKRSRLIILKGFLFWKDYFEEFLILLFLQNKNVKEFAINKSRCQPALTSSLNSLENRFGDLSSKTVPSKEVFFTWTLLTVKAIPGSISAAFLKFEVKLLHVRYSSDFFGKKMTGISHRKFNRTVWIKSHKASSDPVDFNLNANHLLQCF